MSSAQRHDDDDQALVDKLDATSLPTAADEGEVTATLYDPTSTLLSAKRFEDLGLRKELLDAVHAAKFVKPSKIQEKALPLILNDPPRNLIGQAKSGSGKTAAFALGMLNRVDENLRQTQGVCICPTRELATQIYDVFKRMSGTIRFEMFLAVKEENQSKLVQEKIAPHIIIGTPGRLLSLFKNRLIDLTKVRVFVCDEADVMMDKQGMADDTKRIKSWLPKNCQILLFSATFKEEVKAFALQIVSQPNIIMVKKEELNVEAIKQFFIRVDNRAGDHGARKYSLLASLYSFLDIAQSIIFVETRQECDDLYRRLKADGHEVSALHSDLSADQRDRVMLNFRKGESKVLLATNVLSRGIDVLQVSLVVNYDLPYNDRERTKPDKETYLHRVGRSGRFGRKGTALTLCDDDKAVQDLLEIAREYSMSMDELPPNEDRLEEVLRPILNQQKKELEEHIRKYGMNMPLEEPTAAPLPAPQPAAEPVQARPSTWADEADAAPGWSDKPERSHRPREEKQHRQPRPQPRQQYDQQDYYDEPQQPYSQAPRQQGYLEQPQRRQQQQRYDQQQDQYYEEPQQQYNDVQQYYRQTRPATQQYYQHDRRQ